MSRDLEGVGFLGRLFVKAFNPPPERSLLLPPSGTGIGRKRHEDPAPYAPPIIRERREWPGGPRPGGAPAHQEWPYLPWPGGRP